jgi:hypothetical protein
MSQFDYQKTMNSTNQTNRYEYPMTLTTQQKGEKVHAPASRLPLAGELPPYYAARLPTIPFSEKHVPTQSEQNFIENIRLRRDISFLNKEKETLQQENDAFRKENDALHKENDTLRKENITLHKENDELRHQMHMMSSIQYQKATIVNNRLVKILQDQKMLILQMQERERERERDSIDLSYKLHHIQETAKHLEEQCDEERMKILVDSFFADMDDK